MNRSLPESEQKSKPPQENAREKESECDRNEQKMTGGKICINIVQSKEKISIYIAFDVYVDVFQLTRRLRNIYETGYRLIIRIIYRKKSEYSVYG